MNHRNRSILIVLVVLCAANVSVARRTERHRAPAEDTTAVEPPKPFYVAEGEASWYGRKFQGRRTASGERFNRHALTCAHPTLPFGTRVVVTNVESGERVTVRVNDRGPFVRQRIIDLSYAAAKKIHIDGCAQVRIDAYAADDAPPPLLAATRSTPRVRERIARAAQPASSLPDSPMVVYTVVMDPMQDTTLDTLAISHVAADVRVADASFAPHRPITRRACVAGVRIVDTNDVSVEAHGYSTVVMVTNNYRNAAAVLDMLRLRGYQSVHLVIASTCGETHYKVCVGFEPVPIACRITADNLAREFPATTIAYIERADDDQHSTASLAY